MKKTFNFLKALAVFLGTIVGAGIFGLPFVASKAGFLIIIAHFAALSFFVILIDWLYCKVALATKEIYRLPGYIGKYFNPFWKRIVFLVIFLGTIGGLLAYLIIGGNFLFAIFSPFWGGSVMLYTFLFFAVGSLLIFKGIKSIAGMELILMAFLFVILGLFFVKAFPLVNINYFKEINWGSAFLPYGVVLFSLWGSSVMPELKEMVKSKKALKTIIILGVGVSALIYLFFIFVVLGISGQNTSQDAISGISQAMGSFAVNFGFIFGVIAVFTSFLTIGLTLKNMLWHDFSVPKNMAWFMTCFLPFLLFVIGLRQFIGVIGFTGAVSMGLEGIIMVLLYKEFLKDRFNKKMNPFLYFLILVFVLGIIFEIINIV